MATELEVAWAVGLFEGEGSITHTRAPHIRLSLATTDADVLDRFHRIVGTGSRGGWQGLPPRKYTYQWYLDGDAAIEWLRTMLPLLGERRAACAKEALAQREQYISSLTASRECAGCGDAFTPQFTPGQPQRYCTVQCREAAGHRRRRDRLVA